MAVKAQLPAIGECLVDLQRIRVLSSIDPERSHASADAALCTLLMALGYAEIVDVYESITKWYA